MSSRNAHIRELCLQTFYKNYSYVMQLDAEVEQYVKLMRDLKKSARNLSVDYLAMAPEAIRAAHMEKSLMKDTVYCLLPDKLYMLYQARYLFEEEVQNIIRQEDAAHEDEAPSTPLPEDYLWSQVWTGEDLQQKIFDVLAEAPQVVIKKFAEYFHRKKEPVPEPIVPLVSAAKRCVVVCPTPMALAIASKGTPNLQRSIEVPLDKSVHTPLIINDPVPEAEEQEQEAPMRKSIFAMFH